ncbi:MAG: DUF3772 domain-containing protein [Pseudomonadota bacterium]
MAKIRQRIRIAILMVGLAVGLGLTISLATAQRDAPQQGGAGQAGQTQPAGTPSPGDLALPDYTERLKTAVDRLPLELDRLRKATERLRNDSIGLADVRAEIDKLRGEIARSVGGLEPLLPTVQAQLNRLGPAPKPEDPIEDPTVTREREKLDATRAEIDGAIKRLQLTDVRAEQLMGRLQQKRNTLLAADLLSKTPSPLAKTVWTDLRERIDTVWRQFAVVITGWLSLLSESPIVVAGLVLVAFVIYAALVHLRDRFVRRTLRVEASGQMPLGFFRRTKIAFYLAPAFAAPRLALAGILTLGVVGLTLYNSQVDDILYALLKAFVLYAAVAALARAVLTPNFAAARLVGVDDSGAQRLSILSRLLALVFGIDMVLSTTIETLLLPSAFGIVAGFLANALFALLLTALVATTFVDEEATEGGQLVSRIFEWMKIPVYAAALAVLISSLLGYLTLGRFIATQIMFLGIGGFTVFLAHRAIAALSEETTVMQATGSAAAGKPRGDDRFNQVVRIFLNLALGVAALIATLLSVGFSLDDVSGLATPFFSGFEVGGVRVVPSSIVFAVLLFIGLIFLTRLVQRWLSKTLLTAKRMDPGLANSIHTGIGYAGMAIAVLVGLSYAGLDITNLAIVAGALSVGIGFGLQSIVNNFVSGLILLVERPVKVGDWIVVNGAEGFVRRISVRATEIETFNRASLILPNSELITGTVQNWTHRNALGRVDVSVGVGYDSDPQKVMDLLLKIADESEMIIRFPAPFVSFDNLGNSALEFTLRAFVSDVTTSLSTRTKLRHAIVEAFREEGIEIPFPQQDIHIRDVPGAALSYVVETQRRAS